jgi:hypothetical protein
MGAARPTLEELIWKSSPDRWEDVDHLSDAELVEYLFRISNRAYAAVLGDMFAKKPARERLARIDGHLSDVIRASRKGGWYHQVVNDSNSVRERRIRATVLEARTRVALDIVEKSPPEPAPPPEPAAAEPPGADRVGKELARLAVLRQRVARDRRRLREEIRLLCALRERYGAERAAWDGECRRQLVRGVLGLVFFAAAGFLAILGLKS